MACQASTQAFINRLDHFFRWQESGLVIFGYEIHHSLVP